MFVLSLPRSNCSKDVEYPVHVIGIRMKWTSFAVAASTICAAFGGEAVAMQNPFLDDLKSVSVACDGDGAQTWCEIASALIKDDMKVPVVIVDMSALPLNASGLPSANHGWVTLSVRPSGDDLAVDLTWGSAMRMTGVDAGHAAHKVGSIHELQKEDVWRQVLAPTPFVFREK
jgi:hypothetical protein